MTRVFRDSTNPNDIPLTGLDGVMGYGNGDYEWQPWGWRQFGGLPWVKIDVLGTDPEADMLDYENGDVNDVPSAQRWVSQRAPKVPEYYPVVYCDRDNYHILFPALGPKVRYVVATLDSSLFTGPQVIACQHLGAAQTGGNYDETVVYDDKWLPVKRGLLIRSPLKVRRVIARDRNATVWK